MFDGDGSRASKFASSGKLSPYTEVPMPVIRTLTLILLLGACSPSKSVVDDGPDTPGASSGPSAEFADGVRRLLSEHQLSSIGVAVVQDGQPGFATAYGVADQRTQQDATGDTIYALASCSKPIVGLATARLMELHPEFDLDADINTYLRWPTSLTHPDHPATPVTMRQLLRHRSAIAENGPADYSTYPKPDPDVPLDTFLRGLLTDTDDYWLDHAPGGAEAYSNLGAALAGLVIEKVAGTPFNTFCNEQLFTPLGMDDTRWLFAELSSAQQSRVALPHDDALNPYVHYAFNDYPSGLLRASPRDFARLLAMLVNRGILDGTRVLTDASVSAFETTPMFIEPSTDGGVATFSHDGGETGVNTAFLYRQDGDAYVYLINSDLDDDALDTVAAALEALIEAELE
ncbi:MAG: CubicO group peptidase (beta-lactamase class C family) [Myxococcota bacterium]